MQGTPSTHADLTVRPPVTREQILAELSRLAAEVEGVAASFTTAAFFSAQVEEGTTRWSPAEQVRHLTRSTYPLARAFAMPRLLLALRFGVTLRRAGMYEEVAARYERLLATKPDAGRFAPSRDDQRDDARRAEIMARFRDAISRLAGGVERWPERALDRHRLPHPALGRMSCREMLFFTLFHTAHHGGQMERRATAGSGA